MTDSPVYLDYQASAPIDPAVLAAMIDAYAAPGNASSEGHSFGWRARDRVEVARRQVAQLVNAEPEEVIFTAGASEANNIAILGAARAAPPGRRRILVSSIEHKSVLEPAKILELEGFNIQLIPAGRDGIIDLAALKAQLRDDVAVVSTMAVNHEIGTVQPISEIATLGAAVGAYVHVDATQALAAVPVDVRAWGVASLAMSAHKFHGPTGVGALILADDAPWCPRPIAFGGGQESGLRPGTIATPLCVGLGVACALLAERGGEDRRHVAALRDRLANALRGQGVDFAITAETSPRHPGSLHIRLPGVDAADLLTRLQPHLAASTGSACTSGVIGPSEVLLAIGMTAEEASQCLRLSLGRFTTAEEIDVAADRIAAALGRQMRLRP